jgi:hypothetical protein
VPHVTVGVEVLHLQVHHVGAFQRLAGLEGALPDPTGHQVAKLDPVEGLTLARLDQLVLDDGAGIAVQHHLQTAFEFVGRIVRHCCFTHVRAQRRHQWALAENMMFVEGLSLALLESFLDWCRA